MSTMMDKGRNLGTSFWLLLLLVSVAIFGLNTGFATYLGSKLAGAGSAAAY
jgi:twitching motility protein PilJ